MVTIVYVNWNTSKWIESSIRIIKSNPPLVEYEIIVVDNGSKERFLEKSDIKVIYNEHNMGFGHACNQGILASKGKYICFLNPDTEPEAGWLDYLVKYLEEHPECGLVAPSMTNVCQPKQSPLNNKGETVEVSDVIPFACVVIPKKIFCKCGLLSMLWGEDTEFCRRITNLYYTLVVVGKAFVKHVGGIAFSENEVGYNTKMIVEYLEEHVYPKICGE